MKLCTIILFLPCLSVLAYYPTNQVPVGQLYPAFWAGAGLQTPVTYQWSNSFRQWWPSYVYTETIATNITGLDNTGATDVTSGIQAAYNSLSGTFGASQVAVLPAGTFKINSTLILNKGSCSLRGTEVAVGGVGSNATVLLYSTNNSPGAHVLTVGNDDNTFDYQFLHFHTNLLYQDALRGSSNILLNSSALADISVGDTFLIDRLPDVTNVVYTWNGTEAPVFDQCPHQTGGWGNLITWGSRGAQVNAVVNSNRICAQWCQATAVANSTNITFWPPLLMVYSNIYQPNVIKVWNARTNIFLECVTVDMVQAIRNPGWGWNGIYLDGLIQGGLWNVNCVQTNGPQTTCQIRGGMWDVIERSFFTLNGVVNGNSQAYGNYSVNPHTGYAFINNIYGTNEVAIGLEGACGGDVIFGNLMNNLVYSDSGQSKRDWGPSHGGFNHMVLVEHNLCPQSYLDVDNYQGNHGYMTFFRNFSGTVTNATMTLGLACVTDWGKNWYCSFIDNFFGQTNVETLRMRTGGDYNSSNYVPGSGNPPIVYSLGYQDAPGDNNAAVDFTFPEMTNVPQTTLHGNWEYPGNSIVYAPTIADHTFPNSYYAPSMPTWWGSNTWPAISSAAKPANTAIPAGFRFYNGTLPANSYFFGPDPGPTPAVVASGGQQWSGGTASGMNVK